MTHRNLFLAMLRVLILTSGAEFVLGQDTQYVSRPTSYYEAPIHAPGCMDAPLKDEYDAALDCLPGSHDEWLKDVTRWRMERRIRIGYNDARYTLPALRWTQSSFMQPQMMIEDRYFYDPVAGKYTVDRYLDDLIARYGGIDSVLIWHTYPNLGIDDRNQLDMIASMPGGVAGVKAMVADFHRRGVRVLFPMMMWDQGTRDPGEPWPDAIAKLMAAVDADGINGDTQDGIPLAFSLAADHIGHPLAFEPEGEPHDEELAWNVLTWGEYTFQFTPFVDRYKWLETRHMVNISDRWGRTKTDPVQFAFFNGVGWNSWENVWGIWNGVTARDGEAVRRIAVIERGLAAYLTSPAWEPFYPMQQYGVFASRWPLGQNTLWTIVNRNEYDTGQRQMSVPWQDEYPLLRHLPRSGAHTRSCGRQQRDSSAFLSHRSSRRSSHPVHAGPGGCGGSTIDDHDAHNDGKAVVKLLRGVEGASATGGRYAGHRTCGDCSRGHGYSARRRLRLQGKRRGD